MLDELPHNKMLVSPWINLVALPIVCSSLCITICCWVVCKISMLCVIVDRSLLLFYSFLFPVIHIDIISIVYSWLCLCVRMLCSDRIYPGKLEYVRYLTPLLPPPSTLPFFSLFFLLRYATEVTDHAIDSLTFFSLIEQCVFRRVCDGSRRIPSPILTLSRGKSLFSSGDWWFCKHSISRRCLTSRVYVSM